MIQMNTRGYYMANMSQSDFIKKVMHKPWQIRKANFDVMDCYGLIYLYFLHVKGIEIPLPCTYENGNTENCNYDELINEKFTETKRPVVGGMITLYNNDNTASHVGIVIDKTHVLHCAGSENNPAKVSIVSIRGIKEGFRFFKYFNCER